MDLSTGYGSDVTDFDTWSGMIVSFRAYLEGSVNIVLLRVVYQS